MNSEVHVMRVIPMVAMLALAGCLVGVAPRPGGVGGPPPAGEPTGGGPIEAGCSFNATQIRPEMGDTVQILCPAGCDASGATWGTDVYTGDSAICRAAIHAGAAPATGGVVTVRLEPGRPAYRGTMRHGVQSSDYGSYASSYRFEGVLAAAPPPMVEAPRIIEAGCSFNATQLKGEVGSAHRIACPPGCGSTNATWGTDHYTGDSAICRAAIHAGFTTDQTGGEVTVILEPGRPAYRGSARHGISSSDYGSYASSFRLER
jgi:hypothetical protein